MLLYPCTAPSRDQFESAKSISSLAKKPKCACKATFSDSPCKLNNKLATPLFATLEERKGLPPALVVGKSDLLRDEIEAYADKLLQAAVDTQTVRVLGAGTKLIMYIHCLFI